MQKDPPLGGSFCIVVCKRMNISDSFSYQFEDAQWPTKLGLATLISLVPILNLALAGYMVQIIRNVADRQAQPLPHWDDIGQKLRDGLILAGASLVYAAPLLIVVCFPLALLIVSEGLSQNSNFHGFTQSLQPIGIALLVGAFGLSLIYGFVLSVLRPIILVIFSRDDTFASCFRLGEIVHILRTSPRPFLATWIVIVLAGFLIGVIVGFLNLLTGWIPCLGWMVGLVLAAGSAVFLLTADAHLFGQFRRAAFETAPPNPPVQTS